MLSFRRPRYLASVIAVLGALCLGSSLAFAQAPPAPPQPIGAACPQTDSGLKLPAGFCATIFADGIGHARHLVVAPDRVVYGNTWSGRYYGNDTPHAGGFTIGYVLDGRLKALFGPAGPSSIPKPFHATAVVGAS
jgi:hypothetical protein